jgi:hypothetical protein
MWKTDQAVPTFLLLSPWNLLEPRINKNNILSKCMWSSNGIHGVISQKKWLLMSTALRISNLVCPMFGGGGGELQRTNCVLGTWEAETANNDRGREKRNEKADWKVFSVHDILSPRAITLSQKGTNVTSGASLNSGGELPKLPHQNGGRSGLVMTSRCRDEPRELRWIEHEGNTIENDGVGCGHKTVEPAKQNS